MQRILGAVTNRGPAVIWGLLLGLLVVYPAAAVDLSTRDDFSGSEDHPMVSRYPGSVITNYIHREYDAFTMPKGPAVRDGGAWGYSRSADLEGELTRIRYAVPQQRSTLEVFRNYEQALQQAGFTIQSTCKGEGCGAIAELLPRMIDDRGTDLMGRELHHLSAVAETPKTKVHLSLLVLRNNVNWLNGHPVVQLDIVETTPMEAGLVEADLSADEMAGRLASEGHVAVYGIHFDLDSDRIRPESGPVLTEVAKLLKNDLSLRLLVVGHTDSQGTLDYNLDLSRRRAAAVVSALVEDHGLKASRLEPHGVAYLAPVATNASEAGRAKNRRVELVQRGPS